MRKFLAIFLILAQTIGWSGFKNSLATVTDSKLLSASGFMMVNCDMPMGDCCDYHQKSKKSCSNEAICNKCQVSSSAFLATDLFHILNFIQSKSTIFPVGTGLKSAILSPTLRPPRFVILT